MELVPDAVRKVTWLELFFDLVFVAAVAQVAAPLADDFSLPGLGRFALLFSLIWWAWLGQTVFSTRFGSGDAGERAVTFLQICAAAAMAVNSRGALDSRDSAGFAAAYAIMRLLLAFQYWRIYAQAGSEGRRSSSYAHVRPLVRTYFRGCLASGALWLSSAFVPPPARFLLWSVAFLVDAATPIVAERHGTPVPPHSEHLPERFGLFTIILLGESMTSVMRGMQYHETWPLAAALSVLTGLVVVYYVWWQYFHAVGAAAPRPIRSRRAIRQLVAWSYAHVPFYIGVAVTGVGFEHLIVSAEQGLPEGTIVFETAAALGLVVMSLAGLRRTLDVNPSRSLPTRNAPGARTWPAHPSSP